jgi:hypothetical protein
MVYRGKEPRASDYVELAARMRVTARYSGPCAADDLRLAVGGASAHKNNCRPLEPKLERAAS